MRTRESRTMRIAIPSIIIFFAGAACVILFKTPIIRAFEDARYAIAPSAEYTYEVANSYLDYASAGHYDIDRAEKYLIRTAILDPEHPYVHHQLARIAFLRGQFDRAMRDINIQLETHPEATPSSYYIRGLIEGYMGRYSDSARDYEEYLKHDPHNWAAINDYAWVLLRAERFAQALDVTESGLSKHPENPWLLNSHAIALYELGRFDDAADYAKRAHAAVQGVTERDWLRAYPGNDPRTAEQGIAALRRAIEKNMHMAGEAAAKKQVQ